MFLIGDKLQLFLFDNDDTGDGNRRDGTGDGDGSRREDVIAAVAASGAAKCIARLVLFGTPF